MREARGATGPGRCVPGVTKYVRSNGEQADPKRVKGVCSRVQGTLLKIKGPVLWCFSNVHSEYYEH
jgi:hypothetical protein